MTLQDMMSPVAITAIAFGDDKLMITYTEKREVKRMTQIADKNLVMSMLPHQQEFNQLLELVQYILDLGLIDNRDEDSESGEIPYRDRIIGNRGEND